MNPIVFLDFDGVLAPHDGRYWPYYSRLAIHSLRKIITVAEAKIVLSSGWKKEFLGCRDPQFLIAYLLKTHGVNCECFGITPALPQNLTSESPVEEHGAHRTNEIMAWLSEHPDCQRYVALDDYPISLARSIQTNPRIGLTLEDADRACMMLRA